MTTDHSPSLDEAETGRRPSALAEQRDLGMLKVRALEAAVERASINWVDPRSIPEQRAKGWPDFHPEDFCHRCGRSNITWSVQSEFWNVAVPEVVSILCPQCFVELYNAATGSDYSWELLPDALTTPWGAQCLRKAEARAERAEELVSVLGEALEAVKHDRPTAHADRIWERLNSALDAARAFTEANPTPGEDD